MAPQLGKSNSEPHASLMLALVPFAAVIAAYGIGSLAPGQATWGIDIWSVLPPWAVAGCVSVYALAAIPAVSVRMYGLVERASMGVRSVWSRIPSGVRAALLSLALLALFYILRSHALVYGDGYLVRDRSADPLSEPFADFHEYSKPITVFVYRIGSLLFSRLGGMDVAQAFSLTTSILGVVGIWALWQLAGVLFAERVARWTVLWGSLGSACTMLFFGYVEQYTLGTVMLLWWLVALVRYYEVQSSYKFLVLITVLTVACNLLIAPIAAMLLLKPGPATTKSSTELSFAFGLRPWIVLLLAAVSSIGIALMMQFSQRVSSIVPIWPKPLNPYWSLSTAHLLDMANVIAHVAPIGILAYLVARLARHIIGPRVQLVAIVAWLLLLTTFWLDPILGAARDWDLVSMFGFPLSIAGIAALVEYHASPRIGKILAVQSALVAVLLIGPNLYEKTHLETAVERLDRIVSDSPHYQSSYRQGRDISAWGAILFNEAQRGDLAKKYFYRVLAADAHDPVALKNLGVVYMESKRLDSAIHYFCTLQQLFPDVPYFQELLAEALDSAGQGDESGDESVTVPLIDSRTGSYRSRGIALAQQGNLEGALAMFRQALATSPHTADAYTDLAQIHQLTGRLDSSVYYYRRALALGAGPTECILRSNILRLLLQSADTVSARKEFEQYVTRCGTEPDVDTFRVILGNPAK